MLTRMFVRRLTTPAGSPSLGTVPNVDKYKKIMELQTSLCRDDGMLVWQKMPRDKMGYIITMFLTAAGLVPVVRNILKMSFPPKQE